MNVIHQKPKFDLPFFFHVYHVHSAMTPQALANR